MGLTSSYLSASVVFQLLAFASEQKLESLQPEAVEPVSPTTKECNSRVHKHIESQKGRCYNRVTEGFFLL